MCRMASALLLAAAAAQYGVLATARVVSVAVDAASGRDYPGCGAVGIVPCASVAAALASANVTGRSTHVHRTVSLRLAQGKYPVATAIAVPAGVDLEITLTAPPLYLHRSFLSCAKGVRSPCITAGDRAGLRLDSLSVASMMAAVGPGGNLTTRSCKFFTSKEVPGQVGLLAEPLSKSYVLPFINMTNTDLSSKPSMSTPVALLAAAPVTARIVLGIGNHSTSPPPLPLKPPQDVFKGYAPELMGHDCYQPQYKSTVPPVRKPLLTVAADGSGDFTTVQAAINAIPEGGRASWADGVTVNVKSGTYRETVCINRNKSFVTVRGDGAGSTTIVGSQGSVELMFRKSSAFTQPLVTFPSNSESAFYQRTHHFRLLDCWRDV
eukprot:COSAG02_NODE_442_length_22243_cov_20.572887_13_plen_379_part_00